MSTATQKRQRGKKLPKEISYLDKQFPGNSVEAVSIKPELDIASIRKALNSGGVDKFDTSSLIWMLETNREKLSQDLAHVAAGRFNLRDTEEREVYAGMLRASEQDPRGEISKELAEYRQFEITSDIMALPFALGAFQSINLGADELPMIITPQARQYFNVRWIGQDGGARQSQWRAAREAANIEMRMIATDKVEYPLIDLQQGDVNEVSKINAQLRFDMEWKLENLALESLEANVVTSGIKSQLNVHPDVNKDNIPDGNYLDLTDVPTYGTANTFTLARLKAILNHIAKWGFGFDPDGPISISTMIMSPQNARDAWDFVDLVSGWNSEGEAWGGRKVDDPLQTVPTETRNNIWKTGAQLNSAWGYSWTTQYNPRLAKGRLYVLTNQPVGWFFTKTNFDRIIEWRDQPDNIEMNYGQIMFRRAIQFFQPSLWAYRYLKVDF